jgi:DNA-binding transcriptional regulator YiaG
MDNSQEWTTVTYIKPPKQYKPHYTTRSKDYSPSYLKNAGNMANNKGNIMNNNMAASGGNITHNNAGTGVAASGGNNAGTSGGNRVLNSSSDSLDLQQATSTSFDKGSQYIPFGNWRKESTEIPFSSKEHRFVSKKDRNSNKTDSETETVHQRLVSKDLSKRITQYRKNNNVTQQQLSDQLGIPLDVVQNYEKGTAVSNKAFNSKFHNLLQQHK